MTREIIEEGDEDPRHGTLAGYKNNRCRCEDCRWANAHYEARYRQSHPRPSRATPEAAQRRQERLEREMARLPPQPRKVQPCGTPAAFRRHQSHGEVPCLACRLAFREHDAKLRRDLRAKRRNK